jgi:hypothetical protein
LALVLTDFLAAHEGQEQQGERGQEATHAACQICPQGVSALANRAAPNVRAFTARADAFPGRKAVPGLTVTLGVFDLGFLPHYGVTPGFHGGFRFSKRLGYRARTDSSSRSTESTVPRGRLNLSVAGRAVHRVLDSKKRGQRGSAHKTDACALHRVFYAALRASGNKSHTEQDTPFLSSFRFYAASHNQNFPRGKPACL